MTGPIVPPRDRAPRRRTSPRPAARWKARGHALLLAAAAALVVPGGGSPLEAQEPAEGSGTVAAGLLIRQLDGVKRVLMVGAHPDDEDTSLLAALARGWGAEAAYLSLSRGEGGQNLIGPELDEGLGIVRTGELLAARELDGAAQFFTRAFDFGYSRAAEETFGHWPREALLEDVVWVVRRFRPHVLVAAFSGTPQDGHGHHQVSALVAAEAFQAAGDPARFPEQLAEGVQPWAPAKLYRLARRDPAAATESVETGAFDPLLGRSHHQVAMESRSQHRSQDMGVPQAPGPRASRLVLLESRVRAESGGGGMFEGVDTTLAGLTRNLPDGLPGRVGPGIEAYRTSVREAGDALHALRPWDAVPSLARAADRLDQVLAALAEAGTGDAGARQELEARRDRVHRALLAAAGVVLDVRSDDDLVVPGEEMGLEVILWNGGPHRILEARPSVDLPVGWTARASGEPPREALRTVEPGQVARWTYRVALPRDAAPSRPYFLRQERDGAMYRWPADPGLRGLPLDPAPVSARVALRVAAAADGAAGALGARRLEDGRAAPASSVEVRAGGPARYVGVDKATGEFREPVLVVPAVSVAVEPAAMAWPLEDAEPRDVTVQLRGEAAGGAGGTVRLEAPDGWSVEPASHAFSFAAPGSSRAFTYRVRPPSPLPRGRHVIRAVATSGGTEYREGFTLIDHPHIQRVALFQPSETRISAFPVQVAAGLEVGYVMGSGDAGAEALRQMGMDVTLLGPEQVRAGAFGSFDVVVLGVRAYETRPDLVEANDRLLEFARAGGTVVAQYNKYEYPDGGFAPYAVAMSRPHDRVTDPAAPVTLLDPDAPVFTRPNRIGPQDFEGWVQERGLYFLAGWSPPFVPLLEMADPGEEPTQGALVVAPVGDGVYVYTGLAFFRQLPEGVPGAHRLLANLVSLRPEDWRRHAAAGEGGR